jgi:hypothetical protein
MDPGRLQPAPWLASRAARIPTRSVTPLGLVRTIGLHLVVR